MANKKFHSSKLVELGNGGYEIVADEPDIRKWKVTNGDGKTLGVVEELLVDRGLNKVRYIVLNLQGKPLNLASRKVLIPIGIAKLDEIADVVILPTITLEHLATLPTHKKGRLTLETERKIRNIFSPSNGAVNHDNNLADLPGVPDDVFYEHEHFDDRSLHNTSRHKIADPAVLPPK